LIAKIPLLDKTEARYAEIARIMWDTNKWIMQIDYGIPFGQNHRYQLGSQP
jgi:4-amino-4-deoxy-L-arabinose transferase-like glycosyltransferase